ncbi:hypothetical protein RUND412_006165 [Rhizina undulata]
MEAELKEYQLQLESVEAALKADPENTELESLFVELKDIIGLTQTVLNDKNGAAPPPPPSPPRQKWQTAQSSTRDNSAIPVDTPAAGSAGSGSFSNFAVGDNVLARWTSGDNQLYPARITSVMGSQKNPVYIVKFTQYNVTETLQAYQIKPASNANKKRKLDGSPVTTSTSTSTPVPSGTIISQPATINAELAEASKRESAKANNDGQKPAKIGRKLAQKKVLEEGKKKWQDFASKGVKGRSGKTKKIGESSMFRTPEGVNGRVGFTGSGQPMRKDATRGKHIYQQGDEEE